MGATPIFKNTDQVLNGAFTANTGLIAASGSMPALMMQNLSISFQQNVNRFYEIGKAGAAKANVYLIGGRASGNMSTAHIVGPQLVMKQFYEDFSDVCNAENNILQMNLRRADCRVGSGASAEIIYVAEYCVLVQVGLAVGAQDLVINQSSNLTFSNLKYDEVGGGGGATGII